MIVVIAIFAFAILRTQWIANEFRKNLWVGQHVDLKQDEDFLSVIITDIDGDKVTVKSISKTLYEVKRKDLYSKK
jgi:hypothetical protein